MRMIIFSAFFVFCMILQGCSSVSNVDTGGYFSTGGSFSKAMPADSYAEMNSHMIEKQVQFK